MSRTSSEEACPLGEEKELMKTLLGTVVMPASQQET